MFTRPLKHFRDGDLLMMDSDGVGKKLKKRPSSIFKAYYYEDW